MFNPRELFTMPQRVTSFLILVSVAAATTVSAPIEAAQQVGGAAAVHLSEHLDRGCRLPHMLVYRLALSIGLPI